MLKRLFLAFAISFCSISAFAIETSKTVWNCPNCGDPYTDTGLQSFAQRAHNLAFGASKMDIHTYNGKTINVGPARWSGLKISNAKGQIVEVDFNPSWAKLFRMQFGMAEGETLTFRMELPNSQLKFPQIKYRPGSDYAIAASQDGNQAEQQRERQALYESIAGRGYRPSSAEIAFLTGQSPYLYFRGDRDDPPPPCHGINGNSGTRCYRR